MAGPIATNMTTIQTVINGNLDAANFATGKIFGLTKLTQDSAVDGQLATWDTASSTWKPKGARYGISVREAAYGAVGDGVANDTAAFAAALTAGLGRTVIVPAGTYKVDSQLIVGAATNLWLFPGATISVATTGGGNAILLDSGAQIYGFGKGSGQATIQTVSGANVDAIITNRFTDGTQEFGYVEGILVLAGAGSTVSVGIRFKSLFVNSGIRDVVVNCNTVATNGVVLTGGTTTGYGPVYLENVWVAHSTGDGVVVTEDSTHPGSASAWLTNVTSEHQASGFHSFKVKGYGGLANVRGQNLHVENGTTAAAASAGLYIDGVNGLTVDGIAVLSSPITNKSGVTITNNALNHRIEVHGVSNINNVTPILDDQQNGVQYGAVSVPFYATPDIGLNQVGAQTLTYGTTVNTNVALGTYCILVATNGTAFTLANPTNGRVGQVISYEIVNSSGGAMGAMTLGSAFVYKDTSYANPANGKRRVLSFISRDGINWAQFGPSTGDM